MQTTMWLGLAMGAIAIINASLMAWLWRFPMAPDPTGRDPNGVSTAPRSWTNVHRTLGYLFVLTYLVLLTEMVPRLWEFREATPVSVLHGVLGLLVGIVLAIKIAVIRRYRRFGNRLPWIGGTLAAATLLVVGLGVVPAWMVLRPLATLPPELDEGRGVVARKCVQCHGASRIAGEREDARTWDRLTREMQRNARRFASKEPITEHERLLALAYLVHRLGETDEEDEEEPEVEEEEREEGGRRRRRGRDH